MWCYAPHDPLTAVLHGQCLELQQRLPNILSWEEKFPPIIGDLASGNRIEDVLEGLKSLARLQPLERRIFIARFRRLLEPFVALEALGPFPGERAKVQPRFVSTHACFCRMPSPLASLSAWCEIFLSCQC